MMLSRFLESNDCETAAGQPGRAVIILLILAALVVLTTSVVIAVRGQESVSAAWLPSKPEVAVEGTAARPEAMALRPASVILPGKTGFTGDLRE